MSEKSDPSRDSKALHSGAYVAMYEKKPLSRIAQLLPFMELDKNTRLLDVACGNAMLLSLVHHKVGSYDGVDFSEDFATAARQRAQTLTGARSTIHCQEIVEFCSTHAGQFDVATALDFSEHVIDDELLPIFAAIHSALRPGGKLYIHTPNLDFFLERMRNAGFILKQRPEHVAVRDTPDTVELLVSAGFERSSIQTHFLPHYNILRILHPLSLVPLIGKWFKARIFIECTK